MRFEVTQPLCFGINRKVEIAFAATVRPQRVQARGGVACTRRTGACVLDEVTGGNSVARRLNTVPAKFTTANLFKWLIVNPQLFNKAQLQLFTKRKTPKQFKQTKHNCQVCRDLSYAACRSVAIAANVFALIAVSLAFTGCSNQGFHCNVPIYLCYFESRVFFWTNL